MTFYNRFRRIQSLKLQFRTFTEKQQVFKKLQDIHSRINLNVYRESIIFREEIKKIRDEQQQKHHILQQEYEKSKESNRIQFKMLNERLIAVV